MNFKKFFIIGAIKFFNNGGYIIPPPLSRPRGTPKNPAAGEVFWQAGRQKTGGLIKLFQLAIGSV